MNDLDFIVGTMKQNSNALGFIPLTSLRQRYIAQELYLIQKDNHGNPAGYILHGVPHSGEILTVAQAVIDLDKRDAGYGSEMVTRLIDRAIYAGCRSIKLNCAADLEANQFWISAGFQLVNTRNPSNYRNRAINVYVKYLWARLF